MWSLIKELESSAAEAQKSNVNLKQEILNRQNDLAMQERQKETLEKELKLSIVECEEKASENKSLQAGSFLPLLFKCIRFY